MSRANPKRQTGEAKVSDQGIGEAPVFGSGILLCLKAGCLKPCLQYCYTTESGVRYPSAEKSKNSRAEVLTMNRRDFLQSGGIVSVSLALAKGKLAPDQREDIKKRDLERETRREFRAKTKF